MNRAKEERNLMVCTWVVQYQSTKLVHLNSINIPGRLLYKYIELFHPDKGYLKKMQANKDVTASRVITECNAILCSWQRVILSQVTHVIKQNRVEGISENDIKKIIIGMFYVITHALCGVANIEPGADGVVMEKQCYLSLSNIYTQLDAVCVSKNTPPKIMSILQLIHKEMKTLMKMFPIEPEKQILFCDIPILSKGKNVSLYKPSFLTKHCRPFFIGVPIIGGLVTTLSYVCAAMMFKTLSSGIRVVVMSLYIHYFHRFVFACSVIG